MHKMDSIGKHKPLKEGFFMKGEKKDYASLTYISPRCWQSLFYGRHRLGVWVPFRPNDC